MKRVCCAIIENEAHILIVQRSMYMSNANKWEFPGGKVEQNETDNNCIKREICEELNIKIQIHKKLQPVKTDEIELIAFKCSIISGTIQLSQHSNYKWITINQLNDFDFTEADILIIQNLHL